MNLIYFFNTCKIYFFNKITVIFVLGFLIFSSANAQSDGKVSLQRSLDSVQEVDAEISKTSSHYKPFFGKGDKEADIPKGVNRYGYLTIDPKGESNVVNYGREELVYYVLEGTAMLQYDGRKVPISKDDFFYVPINTDHGFVNPREDTLNIMQMGFVMPDHIDVEPTPELQIASATDVNFQVLAQNDHGYTSSFRLLMGTTRSRRDRLASAYQMVSLYVIEFEPGGTNNPHDHPNAEEIYFVLRGDGEMVAGETDDGEPNRISVEAGDSFFWSAGTTVGFYSNKENPLPARILAVRSRLPEPREEEWNE